MRSRKLLDLVERVVWTALQAFAASVLGSELIADEIRWEYVLTTAGLAALAAAMKVIAAQNFGENGLGDAIPGTVVEAAPKPQKSGRETAGS